MPTETTHDGILNSPSNCSEFPLNTFAPISTTLPSSGMTDALQPSTNFFSSVFITQLFAAEYAALPLATVSADTLTLPASTLDLIFVTPADSSTLFIFALNESA